MKNTSNLIKNVFLILITIILISCNSTTKPKTFKVSGIVRNENGEPVQGAKVLLFTAEKDNNIDFKNKYPNHGASLQFYERFDHRNYTPIREVFSEIDGTFHFSEVSKGRYNVVALKEGVGFEYALSLMIDGVMDDLEISLKEITEIPSVIDGHYLMSDNNIYVSPSDIIILPEATLEIDGNVSLFLGDGCKIDVYGKLLKDSNSFLHIDSNDGLFCDPDSEKIQTIDKIIFYGQNDIDLHGISLANSYNGIVFNQSHDVDLSNCFVKSKSLCISFINCSDFNISNCSITGSIDNVRAGIYIEFSSFGTIERCHLWENVNAMQVSVSSNINILNNYFSNNTRRSLYFARDGEGEVTYNTFQGCYEAIYSYMGRFVAEYNDIQGERGIYCGWVGAYFSANYNNIDCQDYGIKSRCMRYNSPIITIDCKRNYWGTRDVELIRSVIWDMTNEDTDDVNYNLLVSIVEYLPISQNKNDAGVRN